MQEGFLFVFFSFLFHASLNWLNWLGSVPCLKVQQSLNSKLQRKREKKRQLTFGELVKPHWFFLCKETYRSIWEDHTSCLCLDTHKTLMHQLLIDALKKHTKTHLPPNSQAHFITVTNTLLHKKTLFTPTVNSNTRHVIQTWQTNATFTCSVQVAHLFPLQM